MARFINLKTIDEIEKACKESGAEAIIVDNKFVAVKIGKIRIYSSESGTEKSELTISKED